MRRLVIFGTTLLTIMLGVLVAPGGGAQAADVRRGATTMSDEEPQPGIFGPFTFRAAHSGKCLESPDGGREDGLRLQQSTCVAGAVSQHLYLMEPFPGSVYYYIAIGRDPNQQLGQCLSVQGGPAATGDAVAVLQERCQYRLDQLWYFRSLDSSPFSNIVARHSNRCLDVIGGPTATGDGVHVQQWGCLGPRQTNQRWRRLPA